MAQTSPDRLRQRVEAQGRSGVELAERCRVSYRRMLRLMRGEGKHGPTLAEVKALARELECSPSWLAFGVG